MTNAEKIRAYRSTRREEYALRQRQYYQRHKERIAAYDKMRKKRDRPRLRARDRLKNYGLTEAAFQSLLAGQDGKCAICQKTLILDDTRQTVVDHCHKTDVVRGLLCQGCNRGMGLMGDSATSFRRAITYLERFQS